MAVGFRVEEGILRDDEFGRLQARDHVLAVRHACHGIGADDPARLDRRSGHLLEHRDIGEQRGIQ